MLSNRSPALLNALRRPAVLGAPSSALRPPRPSHRTFSLWPSAPSPPPAAQTEATQLTPPSLTDLTAPLHLPTATFFEPASTLLLSIPSVLPISLSFAALIPIITLFIRGTTTLPLTRWQRARTRRYEERVMPEVRQQQEKVRWEVRDQCRRAGKSFEEYQKAYAKAVRLLLYRLVGRSLTFSPGQESSCSRRSQAQRAPSPHSPSSATTSHPHLHRHNPHPSRRLRPSRYLAPSHFLVSFDHPISIFRRLVLLGRDPQPNHPQFATRPRRDSALLLVPLARPARSDDGTPPRCRSSSNGQRRSVGQDSTSERRCRPLRSRRAGSLGRWSFFQWIARDWNARWGAGACSARIALRR